MKSNEFGKVNRVMLEEENSIISSVNKALSSSMNSAIIGRNGEIPLKDFLIKYLPKCFMVESGHFIDTKSNISPQIDIMILDSRFPVLVRNSDDSVLAMGHSVICCISVKSKVIKREIKEIIEWAEKINSFSNSLYPRGWKEITLESIAYIADSSTEKIKENFFELSKKTREIDLTVLRKNTKEQKTDSIEGFHMWWENLKSEEIISTASPLSDFLFGLIQNSYYTLDARNLNYKKIGEIIMGYLTWGSIK